MSAPVAIGDRAAVEESYFNRCGVMHKRLTWGVVENVFDKVEDVECYPYTGFYVTLDCYDGRTITVPASYITLVHKA